MHQNSILSLLVFHSFLIHLKSINASSVTGSDPGTGTGPDVLDRCVIQVCNFDEPVTRYVGFPFMIRNESLPKACGYPGFDLICNGHDMLALDLPNSGRFSVVAIDYIKQEIWLNDTNNCLPKTLLSLNSETTARFSHVVQSHKRYWLYNCSNDYFESVDRNVKKIECLSGARYGVVASPVMVSDNVTDSLCNYMDTIQLPDGWDDSDEVRTDVRLSWVEPGCSECYLKRGRCGFKSYSSLEVGCFDVRPRHGLRKETLVAIALAFAAPLAFFTCCTTYIAIQSMCARRRRSNNSSISLTIAVTPHPRQAHIHGLDRSIIESYPKVVLGESRRLPNPDDKSCPICLGEYLATETLRTLPECSHCFHAECIDEWLELNASCPVCRNTPSNTPDVHR